MIKQLHIKQGQVLHLLSEITIQRQDLNRILKIELPKEDSISEIAIKKTTDFLSDTKIKIFISYCWADSEIVHELYYYLSMNFDCWIDIHNMKTGSELFNEIEQSITSTRVFIACCSNHYSKSVNCNRELSLASERKKLIFPVRIGVCDMWPPTGAMGPLLTGKLYVDLSTKELYSSTISQLVRALQSVDK